MNIKKITKSFLAVGAAVTMLLGTSLTALAAPAGLLYGTAEDYQTVYRPIQEADANVIATSDATQLYLTGSMTMIYDRYGSPDPQLINNGDGTWTLIMYEYQEVALGLNNPYTAYGVYKPQVMYANPTYQVADDGGIDPAWDDLVRSYNEEGESYCRCNWTDAYNYVIVDADLNTTGSAVYNIQLEFDESLGYWLEDLGIPETFGNTVTLIVNVLPAQVGYQGQICAAWETSVQPSGWSTAKTYLELGVRNSKAIN